MDHPETSQTFIVSHESKCHVYCFRTLMCVRYMFYSMFSCQCIFFLKWLLKSFEYVTRVLVNQILNSRLNWHTWTTRLLNNSLHSLHNQTDTVLRFCTVPVLYLQYSTQYTSRGYAMIQKSVVKGSFLYYAMGTGRVHVLYSTFMAKSKWVVWVFACECWHIT